MFRFTLLHFAVLFTFLGSPLVTTCQAEPGNESEATFETKAKPFFVKYCMECHDNDTLEGKISLENLRDVSAENASMWKRIWEQVALKEMPPRKERNQPELLERLELSNWITAGLTKAMKDKGGFSEHMHRARAII